MVSIFSVFKGGIVQAVTTCRGLNICASCTNHAGCTGPAQWNHKLTILMLILTMETLSVYISNSVSLFLPRGNSPKGAKVSSILVIHDHTQLHTAFFLLNEAFAKAVLDLISRVHLPSFVNMLPKYLKHSTFSSCFWSIIIVTGDGCLEILITFVFSTFISMPIFKFYLFFLLALQPPLRVVFYSPLAGFSLLTYEVSWSHTTTHHSR